MRHLQDEPLRKYEYRMGASPSSVFCFLAGEGDELMEVEVGAGTGWGFRCGSGT
jgi:hypothetical protein